MSSRSSIALETNHPPVPANQLVRWLAPGIFLLLVSELFLTLCALGAYVIFRITNPEIERSLLRNPFWAWGAAQLGVLVLAASVGICLPRLVRKQAVPAIMVTATMGILYGLVCLGIKGLEAETWSGPHIIQVQNQQNPAISASHGIASKASVVVSGDAVAGAKSFGTSCAACHGAKAQGDPQNAPSLLDSAFVGSTSDALLSRFIIAGRPMSDPANRTGKAMPSRGGNPFLSDTDVRNIVAFLRSLKTGGSAATADNVTAVVPTAHQWVVPAPPPAPSGFAASFVSLSNTLELPRQIAALKPRPEEIAMFPWIGLLSGLHAIHVLLGLILFGDVLWRAFTEQFDASALAAAALVKFHAVSSVLVWLVLVAVLYWW